MNPRLSDRKVGDEVDCIVSGCTDSDLNGPQKMQVTKAGDEKFYGDGIALTLSNETTLSPKQQRQKWTQSTKKRNKLRITVHHDRVQTCGHKYDESRPPNNNCERCWFTWFNIHGELVQATEEAFQKYGKEMVVGIQGEKFFKMWLRFMATVANMKNVITGN